MAFTLQQMVPKFKFKQYYAIHSIYEFIIIIIIKIIIIKTIIIIVIIITNLIVGVTRV